MTTELRDRAEQLHDLTDFDIYVSESCADKLHVHQVQDRPEGQIEVFVRWVEFLEAYVITAINLDGEKPVEWRFAEDADVALRVYKDVAARIRRHGPQRVERKYNLLDRCTRCGYHISEPCFVGCEDD